MSTVGSVALPATPRRVIASVTQTVRQPDAGLRATVILRVTGSPVAIFHAIDDLDPGYAALLAAAINAAAVDG